MKHRTRREAIKLFGTAGASAYFAKYAQASDPKEHKFGYLWGQEDYDKFDEGVDPERVLTSLKAENKDFNPYARPWTTVEHQGKQGACQGHSLALAFQVCMVQKYSIHTRFSRAAAYYMSQTHDNIKGDMGSTLAGGQAVARNGLCLETEWPYPEKYNPARPDGVFKFMDFKMPGSKRIKDADLAWELLRNGACIQTGVAWGSAYEAHVSDRYDGFQLGGHSTLLYGLDHKTDNAIHHNSWGVNWQNNGRSQWTKRFFNEILKKDKYCVFVTYDSTNLKVPANFVDRSLKN